MLQTLVVIEIEVNEATFSALTIAAVASGKTVHQLAEEIILHSLNHANGAFIPCAGPCRQWTGHGFRRIEDVPHGRAMIYGCIACGTERRYGLSAGPGEIDDDVDGA